ncbi:hypothetical protein PUN28_009677 [Cardiocondyla obscurior]|uniref:Uncharacterized protein n=1 Tax=Cardiocondyla obscurior TaxID=286306 RepID=A0AAW2FZ44_9HYME
MASALWVPLDKCAWISARTELRRSARKLATLTGGLRGGGGLGKASCLIGAAPEIDVAASTGHQRVS